MGIINILEHVKDLVGEDDNPMIIKRIERLQYNQELRQNLVRQGTHTFIVDSKTGTVICRKKI